MIKTLQISHSETVDRDQIIRNAVIQNTDKCGAVYTDVLVEATGLDKRVITDYLKRAGFEKRAGGTSRRWIKDWASNPLDHFVTPDDPQPDPDDEQERDPPLDEGRLRKTITAGLKWLWQDEGGKHVKRTKKPK